MSVRNISGLDLGCNRDAAVLRPHKGDKGVPG